MEIISNSSIWFRLNFLITSIIFLVCYLIVDFNWITSIVISSIFNLPVSVYLGVSRQYCSHIDRDSSRDSKRSWEVCTNCQKVLDVEVLV